MITRQHCSSVPFTFCMFALVRKSFLLVSFFFFIFFFSKLNKFSKLCKAGKLKTLTSATPRPGDSFCRPTLSCQQSLVLLKNRDGGRRRGGQNSLRHPSHYFPDVAATRLLLTPITVVRQHSICTCWIFMGLNSSK